MSHTQAHYNIVPVLQLPTEYFTTVLGKWRKYSACYYTGDNDTIDQAEENMLRAYFHFIAVATCCLSLQACAL